VILLDRPGQRMGEALYLFEFHDDGSGPGSAHPGLDAVAARAHHAMETSPGARRLVLDHVTAESEVHSVDEEGQGYTGRLVDSTILGYLWFAFDNHQSAQSFFRAPGIARSLLGGDFRRAAGFHLKHDCIFDRRAVA
jgi:hypothetical protein